MHMILIVFIDCTTHALYCNVQDDWQDTFSHWSRDFVTVVLVASAPRDRDMLLSHWLNTTFSALIGLAPHSVLSLDGCCGELLSAVYGGFYLSLHVFVSCCELMRGNTSVCKLCTFVNMSMSCIWFSRSVSPCLLVSFAF